MEGFSEGSSEGLQRSIVGIEGYVRDGESRAAKLKGRSLQQQSTTHCGRRLFHDSTKQSMELCSALVGAPREVVGLGVRVERVHHYPGQSLQLWALLRHGLESYGRRTPSA